MVKVPFRFGEFAPDSEEYNDPSLEKLENGLPMYGGYRGVRQTEVKASVEDDTEVATGAYAHLLSSDFDIQHGKVNGDETDLEAFGTLVLAVDGSSTFDDAALPNVTWINDRSTYGPSTTFTTTVDQVRTASDALFGNKPSLKRELASQYFDLSSPASPGGEIRAESFTAACIIVPGFLGQECEPFDTITNSERLFALRLETDGSIEVEDAADIWEVAPASTLSGGWTNTNIIIITAGDGVTAQCFVDAVEMPGASGAGDFSGLTPGEQEMSMDRIGGSVGLNGKYSWGGLYLYDGILARSEIKSLGQWISDRFSQGQDWSVL